MEKALAAKARALSGSSVTQTGRATTIRGAGRPAADAAAVIVGTMYELNVLAATIQVMVPSASSPVSFNIWGASAATRTGHGCAPATLRGAIVRAVTVAPSNRTCSP